jgi:hypothetical protein
MSPDAPFSATHESTHPSPDIDVQAACVAACVRAATVCSVSADAYLDDPDVADLRRGIRLALDAVDVLGATATVLSRHFGALPASVGQLVSASIDAVAACADELELAGPVEHRRRCVDECRRCAHACRALLDAARGHDGHVRV